MKTTSPLLAGLAVAAALASGPAAAAERAVTVTGPEGGVIQRDVDRAPGAVDVAITGPQGRTFVRTVRRTPDGAVGTVTGPLGRVVVREVSR